MTTKEEWFELWMTENAPGSLQHLFGLIQKDARQDLEQRLAELEKDKARLDWLELQKGEPQRLN